MKYLFFSIIFLSYIVIGFIGCSNTASNGSTIKNESNINPSVGNNTIQLDTGIIPLSDTRNDQLVYQSYFNEDRK